MIRVVVVAALTGFVALIIGVELGRRWTHRDVDLLASRVLFLKGQLAAERRDPAHRRCRQIEQRLFDEIDYLEDQRDDISRVVGEAEQIARKAAGS